MPAWHPSDSDSTWAHDTKSIKTHCGTFTARLPQTSTRLLRGIALECLLEGRRLTSRKSVSPSCERTLAPVLLCNIMNAFTVSFGILSRQEEFFPFSLDGMNQKHWNKSANSNSALRLLALTCSIILVSVTIWPVADPLFRYHFGFYGALTRG